MTTIAWDGKTLAGDRKTVDVCVYGGTKVFRVGHGEETYLVAASGNSSDCDAFVEFAKKGFKDRPKFTDFTGIRIAKDGTITRYDEMPNESVFKSEMYALGSGGKYAIGAMAHGATAVEAVGIASSVDVYTGLGVDTVDFS
jgi:hypothetical protein